MRILVTGASSQTGSLAVRALVGAGHAVRCLVRREEGRKFLPARAVEFVPGNLEQAESLRGALEGVEAVAHIAHIRFAPAVIGACEARGVPRVIFFSSTRRFTQFDCESARQVRNGEAAIEQSRLEWTILRPSMIYGSSRDNNISKLIAYFRRHRLFPLVGGGCNLVQPVFTLDVVAALLEALQRPVSVRKIYTLAGPEALTYRQMIESVCAALGRRPIFIPVPLAPMLWAARCHERLSRRPRVTVEQIQRLAEDKTFDISDARRDLGFSPVPFAEGIRRQVAGEIERLWNESQPNPEEQPCHCTR
ncbi:MAG: NAD(P)H-binding protein [Candidatus Sumerlaeia bacterium]|nr:NAD(P)H-binding protein [Candidatus Sumerlaeia bacterium]